MKPSELESRLARLQELAPEPPEQLLTAATASTDERPQPRRATRGRLAVALLSAVGVVALAFTPPGRAATDWLVEASGLRSEPTVPQVRVVEGSASVIAEGELEDGTRFEIVAREPRGVARGLVCFGVDWVDLAEEAGGGACTRSHRTGGANELALETSGAFLVPGGRKNGGPAVFLGIADDPAIASVEVRSESDGGSEKLESRLLTLDGEALAAVGGDYPVKVAVAPLGSELTSAGADGYADVVVAGLTSEGTLVDEQEVILDRAPSRQERKQAEQVFLQERLLDGRALPAQLRELGGIELEPPTEEELMLVKGPRWDGKTAQEALAAHRSVAKPVGSFFGSSPVHLARADGALVYVISLRPTDKNPAQTWYTAIYDARTLEELHREQRSA